MEEAAPAYKRSLKTLFIRPTRQFKLTMAMLSVGILSSAFLMGYLIVRLSAVIASLQHLYPDAAAYVTANIGPTLDFMLVAQLTLWVASVFLGMLISHRIYGPMVPMVRHIRNLGKGEYASRVRLRGGDDMEELANALNELAEQMEKGSPKAD